MDGECLFWTRKQLRGFPGDFPALNIPTYTFAWPVATQVKPRQYLPLVIVLCLSLRAPLRERVGSGDTPGDTHVKNTMLFMLNINMAILIVEPKYTVLQLLIVYYCYDNFVFSCTDHHLHHHLAAVPLGDLPHHLLHPVAERTVGTWGERGRERGRIKEQEGRKEGREQHDTFCMAREFLYFQS